MAISAVLFDLDGTLLDTAPDLGAALNYLLQREGLLPIADELIRPIASNGAKGLIDLGFGESIAPDYFEQLRNDLLTYYQNNLCHHTRLFDGISNIIEDLVEKQIPWGIVTNKPGWLTVPLLLNFPEFATAGTTISGDTLPVRKPDPTPLLYAADQLGVSAERCLYVGDALRDIEAGQRAGMKTMIAAYGYIHENENPSSWGADITVAHPDEISLWLFENSQS